MHDLVRIFTLIIAITAAFAAYAGSAPQQEQGRDARIPESSFADTSAPGYVPSGQSPPKPVPSDIPGSPGFNFNMFLEGYFQSLQRFQEQFVNNGDSYAYATNGANSFANADSSFVFTPKTANDIRPDGNSVNRAHEQPFTGYGFPNPYYGPQGHPMPFNGFKGANPGVSDNIYGSGYGGGYYGNNGQFSTFKRDWPGYNGYPPIPMPPPRTSSMAQGAAFATSQFGPGGIHQTASVYPANPNIPNVDIKMDGKKPSPGFYGVYTSSQSSSSDINGKKTQFQHAQTTVNDNGKITTYNVTNPSLR